MKEKLQQKWQPVAIAFHSGTTKIKNFLLVSKQRIASLNFKTVSFFVMLLALPIVVASALTVQNLSQHAASSGPAFLQPKDVPVLIIEYFPLDPNDPTHIDKNEAAGDQNFWLKNYGNNPDFFLLSRNQTAVTNGITSLMDFLNKASQYHGYKDESAPQYLHYVKAGDPVINYAKEPTTPTNDGASYPNGKPYIWLGSILASNNICNWVDNHGLREVWIYGYRNQRLGFPESWMSSGKYGYVSNQGKESDLGIPPLYRMPVCNHSYTVFNYEYQLFVNGGIGSSIHDHMHQLEALISYAAGDEGFPVDDSGNGTGIFAGNFTRFGKNQNGCGTTHNPPNTTYANQYHYWETNIALSNCENWPQNNYQQVSCSNWGCSGENDVNYYKWWMQNLPGLFNNISYQGKGMRNWWDLVVDFDKFLAAGRTLLCNTINCRAAPAPVGGYCAGHGGAANTYPQCGDVPHGPCNNTDPNNLNIIYHCHDGSWECDDSRGQMPGQCGVVNTNPNTTPTSTPTPNLSATPTPTSAPTPTPTNNGSGLASSYCSGYTSSKGDNQCFCQPVSVTATQDACINGRATHSSITWNGANCLYCTYTLKWTDGNGLSHNKTYSVPANDCTNKKNELSYFEKLTTSIDDQNGISTIAVMPYTTTQSTSVALNSCGNSSNNPTPTPNTNLPPTPTPSSNQTSSDAIGYCSGYSSSKGNNQCYCQPVSVKVSQAVCSNGKVTSNTVTWNGANCLYCTYTLQWTDGNGGSHSTNYAVPASDCDNKKNEITYFENISTTLSDQNGISNVSVMPLNTTQKTSVITNACVSN